jgi:hypothetical protein
MAAVHVMPIRGERSAPLFDQKEPSELGRYFKQLEMLFTRCTINEDKERKEYATSYVKSNVADSWEALPEFSSDQKTYEDFKERLYELYNQSLLRYILADLDRLVGERQRVGMRSLQDISEFHLQFNTISTYLLTNSLVSSHELSQSYLRVFDESFQTRVLMRLNILLPHHNPALPYPIDDIYNASKWVLQGVPGTTVAPPYAKTTSTASKASSEPGFIKTEQLGSFLNDFTKTIVEALNVNRARPSPGGGAPPRNAKCLFDGCDNFIRDCPAVEEYIKQGKCRRNHEGKVILSTGAYVPRDTPGEHLRDRIDEWHRRNPGQIAKGVLSSNTALFGAVVNDSRIVPTPYVETEAVPQYQLNAQDRIAALECELFNLRTRQMGFKPTIKTRSQRAAARNAIKDSEEQVTLPDTSNRVRINDVEPARITEIPDEPVPRRSRSPVEREREPVITVQNNRNQTPEHPFRNAKDATYAPPQLRNIGALVKPAQPVAKKPEPAYRTLPAIHDPSIANTVYNRALETPFTITHRELLSLSPEVRSQIREAVSSKRTPTKEGGAVANAQINICQDIDIEDELSEEELAYLFPDEEIIPYDIKPDVLMLAASTVPINRLPVDAAIAGDPYDEYYRTLPAGQAPDRSKLVVAKELYALRAVVPLINNHLKVESILDPGCQIIAMSEDVCHELVLAYDPSIVLHMESANGSVDPSLGLARNVPFLVGSITVYLQVHVIQSPAYDILLGRPFDVLTESIVRNFKNEDQTITLHDPNSGQVATIPTISRGPPRILSKKNQVFRR